MPVERQLAAPQKAAPPRMVAIVERTRADERSLDPSLTVRVTRTYGEQSRPFTLLVNAETIDLLLNGERRQGLPKMSQYCRKLRLGRLGRRLASVAHVRSRPIPLNAPMGGTVPLVFKIVPIISQLSRRAVETGSKNASYLHSWMPKPASNFAASNVSAVATVKANYHQSADRRIGMDHGHERCGGVLCRDQRMMKSNESFLG